MKLEVARDVYIPDYDGEISKCTDFVTTFQDPTITRNKEDHIHGKLKYMIKLQEVANRQASIIEIELEDIKEFFDSAKDHGFIERVQNNTYRYVQLFSKIIDEHMPQPSINIPEENMTAHDIVMQQRRFNAQTYQSAMVAQGLMRADANQGNSKAKQEIPPELERSYHLSIVPGENSKHGFSKMREIKANQVGSLVTVKGIITRCNDVKPCIQVANYACDACGCEVYQVINQKTFTPLIECPSIKCVKNMVKGQLVLQVKSSKFVSFQELKLQEPSDQVPIGHVPRQMRVMCRGPVTRQCSPGDYVQITGIYMPTPSQGFNSFKTGLNHEVHIEAYKITKDKLHFREHMLSEEMLSKVKNIRDQFVDREHDMFEMISNSICPEIFGMTEIKQALLLLMIGGVTKELKDGMRIRGHLNALLMGDPGVAKSQLLKYISRFAPRGIYTTGKGSSGVGLTAAVLKDPTTGEIKLEGGALVLADTGICCIDEFDKMDERDRTNIHEVMEQQTISIAKAGITTSLNARTSILAAANPVYGRYNKKLAPHENINLPAALLSRFDLIFLLLDLANKDLDVSLARHVTQVHQTLAAPEMRGGEQRIDAEVMRSFIAKAQSHEPTIPHDLHNYIVAKYVEKRKFQREGSEEVSYMYITPRTLLGIIRISQALAKFHFRNEVTQQDVDLALKLMDYSIRSLRNLKGNEDGSKRRQDKNDSHLDQMSAIVSDIRSLMHRENKSQLSIDFIWTQLQRVNPAKYGPKSYRKENIQETLAHYKKLSVVYVDDDQNVIFL